MARKITMQNIQKHIGQSPELADIKPASEWCDDVIDTIMNPNTEQSGVAIHYLDYEDCLRFRSGEVTIWAGCNGHGKSMALSQLILARMFETTFGVISPEMTPVRQMQRMTYQATRMRKPNPDQVRAFHEFTDGRLWLYDQQGKITQPVLLACIRYMAIDLGIKHIVIDSLMKCIQREDDYNEQKAFVENLTILARDLNVHIHLVCHSRKGQKEGDLPDKYDIKGTGAITDLVDNVLMVWRNKHKELKLSKNNLSDVDRRKLEDEPDSALFCVKQRHYDWEGRIALHYQSDAMLLLSSRNKPVPVDWVETLSRFRTSEQG